MIAFIDDHRGEHGVEPICAVLPIAPSTYHSHAARRADPSLLPRRATRDAGLMPLVARVFEENFEVYGVRKVWRQLQREGQEVARCTIERLMQSMGLQGVIRGKPVKTTRWRRVMGDFYRDSAARHGAVLNAKPTHCFRFNYSLLPVHCLIWRSNPSISCGPPIDYL